MKSRIIAASGVELFTCDCSKLLAGCILVVFGLRWLTSYRRRTGKHGRGLCSLLVGHANLAVLITGCDSGIGLENALMFHQLGYTVFAGCLNACSEGAQRLQKLDSHRLITMKLDVTDQLSVDFALQLIDNKIAEFHLTGFG